MPDPAFVHLYTGDGKGKTTAALGLAVRAALSGMRVFIGQFMKGSTYSELGLPTVLPVEIVQYGTPRLICQGEEPSTEDRDRARAGLADITTRLTTHDLVVADEIVVTLHFGLLTLPDVIGLIDARPPTTELVLTGRRAPPELVDRADLVTEMREVKHYYATLGVKARRGIEH
jgi:cob(I)alamin adenosyltransferase